MLIEIGQKAKETSYILGKMGTDLKNAGLLAAAQEILDEEDEILKANAADVAKAKERGMAPGLVDRLELNHKRIEGIVEGMRQVVGLEDPVGEVISMKRRPNGLLIGQKRVPFGVIGIIYEARPNVTADAFALCFKTGNAVILRGGSDALESNKAIVTAIRNGLKKEGIPEDAISLIEDTSHETAREFMRMNGYLDVLIPRGGAGLIRTVVENSTVPVIETGAGICHTYFDRSGDKGKGREIVNNAKTRRVSVCNALDCLIIHRERLSDLPYICGKLPDSNVIIYADEPAYAALSEHYPETLLQQANENSFGTEFLDYKMSIRTVSSLDEALSHIARYSSKHSESIISEDPETIRRFQQLVDAACVYANVSTAFTDGAQFGFGAEIGISTQKLHARGPMALPELTTYKYIIEGDGQTRI